jgi:hypothetical protein
MWKVLDIEEQQDMTAGVQSHSLIAHATFGYWCKNS